MFPAALLALAIIMLGPEGTLTAIGRVSLQFSNCAPT
jgi:hypothetical protein